MELAVRSRASGLKDTLGRGKAAPKHSGGIQPVLVDKTRASRRDSSPSAVDYKAAALPAEKQAPQSVLTKKTATAQRTKWPPRSPTTAGPSPLEH